MTAGALESYMIFGVQLHFRMFAWQGRREFRPDSRSHDEFTVSIDRDTTMYPTPQEKATVNEAEKLMVDIMARYDPSHDKYHGMRGRSW